VKLLTWCRVITLAGLKFVKTFRAWIQNIFIIDFFLSWRRLVLTAVTSVRGVIAIFLNLILFANTAAFFYSLLGWVSHDFWEGDSGEEISTRWRCVEKINHSRVYSLVSRSLQTGFSHLWSYPRKFLLCLLQRHRNSSVTISIFVEKHYIPQYYRWLTCYVCARLCQCFGQGGYYFWCDKPCTCNYTWTQHFLLLRRCVYLNSLGKFGFQD